MDEREFAHLLDVYGADIARWPVELREPAEQFRSRSPSARAALQQGAEVDRFLMECKPRIGDERVAVAIAAVLRQSRGRLQETPPQQPQPDRRRLSDWVDWLTWQWAPRGAVAVGLLILGCVANVLARGGAAAAPLDLWVSTALLAPLGG